MAQEITATAFLSVMKNGVGDSMSANGAITQDGNLFTHQILTCVDEEQELDLGNLTTAAAGFVLFRALSANSASIYVDPDVISDPSQAAIELRAGEFFIGRWNGEAIHAWAAASDLLEYFLLET